MRKSVLAFVILLAALSFSTSAHAAFLGTGCWNCRYSSTYNWPFIFVEAQCVSAVNGGSGWGISCKIVNTTTLLGISLVQDCEFEGGECMYIEVNGRNESAGRHRGTPRHATQPKIHLF
jgi:hypothetical protein